MGRYGWIDRGRERGRERKGVGERARETGREKTGREMERKRTRERRECLIFGQAWMR